MGGFPEGWGMVTGQRDASRVYMRGIGDTPYLHVTELGTPGVVSFAYELREPGQLTELAKLPGLSAVEQLDAPGGGARVRLRDPNGLWLALGTGREPGDPLPPRPVVRPPDGASRPEGPAP